MIQHEKLTEHTAREKVDVQLQKKKRKKHGILRNKNTTYYVSKTGYIWGDKTKTFS